jgi:uncharacterized protein
MKIDRIAAEGRNLFTGYGEGYVEVNGRRIASSAIVTGNTLAEWAVESVDALKPEHIAALLEKKPEIVILGSGAKFAFPDPAVLAPLYAARIGVEVMDTHAACRTYNILLGEDRAVLAALVI